MVPKTFESYRLAWNQADTLDPAVPLNLDLELASVCNLRCPFCFIPDPNFEAFISQKAEDGKPLRRLMPKDLAFRVIDEAARIGVPALKFNWRGESTLHPDYSEIVKYAANKVDWVATDWISSGKVIDVNACKPHFIELLANTNANCSDKSIDGLMATTKCMVSLDSMVPGTYATMRAGGKLQRAKEVVSELVRRGHPNLWIRRVLTKLNFKEDFFSQVKSQWGDKVHVSQHYCFDRNIRTKNEISGCDHDEAMPRRYCVYPSQRLVITSTGKAYPCCIDLHETMPVGDVTRESLLDIWNGEPVKKLRETLRKNDPKVMSETCRNCESWMAYDAPQRTFVKDIEVMSEKEAVLL